MQSRKTTRGRKQNLFLALSLLAATAWGQSSRIITAGGPAANYPTLGMAVASLPDPSVENVEIRVELDQEGFSDPIDIWGAALGLEGHFLDIVGNENPFAGAGEITYYVGGHVEYRVTEGSQVEVVHKYGAPARQIQGTDGTPGEKEFYLTDHLGSTVAMTNVSGTLTSAVYDYFPHGKQVRLLSGSNAPVTETFTGKEMDVYDEDAVVEGQGLYYYGGRYFDPDLGIWISPDPSSQYNSAYAYSTHPIDGVDSDGEFWNILGQMVANGATEVALQWAEAKLNKQEFKIDWKTVASEAVQGGNPVTGALKVVKKAQRAAKIMKQLDKASDASKATKVSVEGVDAAKVAAKGELHRPYIRKGTRAEVEARAPRDASGRAIDPNTGVPIQGKPDLGHKPGHEFRREKAAAQKEGLSQKEFNDRMNNPDLYQLEDPASNRSHKYEMP